MGAGIKKILLVEHNDECRKILTRIVRHLGYDVIQAYSGLDGASRAVTEHPDLILISLDYPQMRGLKVTTWLKNNPQTSDIPILVYPPWDSEDATEAALKAGATEVLKDLDRRCIFYTSAVYPDFRASDGAVRMFPGRKAKESALLKTSLIDLPIGRIRLNGYGAQL